MRRILFLGAFVALRAHAVDVTLVHQGRLVDALGTPFVGSHDLEVSLWSDPDSTDTVNDRLHVDAFTGYGVEGGYYSVVLGGSGGLDAASLVGDVWVQVSVDAVPLLPRTHLAAVPVAAQLATPPGDGVPSGAVMPFDLAACPTGWSEYLPARGRFVRGIDPTGANDPDGVRASGAVQADELASHTHTSYYWNQETTSATARNNVVGNPGTVGGTTQGQWISDATGGAETRPVNVALLYCRKD